MSAAPLIVGYGNPLRADDGVGPVVAEWLAADPRMTRVTVLARHQLTPDLAADIAAAAFVILIDAALDQPPGEVSVAGVDAVLPRSGSTRSGSTTHQVTPAYLVALAGALYGRVPEVIVVGVGVASVDGIDRLSAPVRAAVPRLVDAVAELVAERTAEASHA